MRDEPKGGYFAKYKEFLLFCLSGFDAHSRKRRTEVNSRPLFDSKGKSDAKREKVKQLLGKRKQMQFKNFTSPPKAKSELTKLGIKVRRNRSRSSEGSDKRPDKDPSAEEGPFTSDANLSQTTATSGLGSPEGRVMTDPEVTSQTETHKGTKDRLANEQDHISSCSAIPFASDNQERSGDERSDNLRLICNSSVSSLVCCDYADSSDASDDHT